MLDRLLDLWLQQFQPLLEAIWTSLLFWRSLGLLSIIFGVTTFVKRDRIAEFLARKASAEHDAALFSRADAIFNEPRAIRLWNDLAGGHNYSRGQARQFRDFIEFFGQISNEYADRMLRGLVAEMLACFEALDRFTAENFYDWPDDAPAERTHFCLNPWLNIDRGGTGEPDEFEKYAVLTDALCEHVRKAEASFNNYRRYVKRKYLV